MTAILEAIDVELATARARVTQLEELREKATELEGGGMVEAPVAPAPKAPRRRGERQTGRPGRVVPGEKKRASEHPVGAAPPAAAPNRDDLSERILAHLRATGPGKASAIAPVLHADLDAVRRALSKLASRGELAVEGGMGRAGKTYRIASGEATSPDENGARTDTERKVVEAVRSVELTASEICLNTGIPSQQVPKIADGLVRRGVLSRENVNGRALYGVAG